MRQVSGDVTISRFAPSYPVENLPGDETQFLRPGQPENPELMDYGTVDSENTPTYILFETVWHILFGRPANDHDPLNFHPNTGSPTTRLQTRQKIQDYWCSWFEAKTNSPCLMASTLSMNFCQCWRKYRNKNVSSKGACKSVYPYNGKSGEEEKQKVVGTRNYECNGGPHEKKNKEANPTYSIHSGDGFPYNMTKDTVISRAFCCGTGGFRT